MFEAKVCDSGVLTITRNGKTIICKCVDGFSDMEVIQDLMEQSYLLGVMDCEDKQKESK